MTDFSGPFLLTDTSENFWCQGGAAEAEAQKGGQYSWISLCLPGAAGSAGCGEHP